jgi:hypothetical protein
MFRTILSGAAAAALLAAAPAPAQEPAPEAGPPPEVAAYVRDLFNDPATLRRDGRTHVGAGDTLRGDLAVADGPLVLTGRVEGDVVVINGDAELHPGASIAGRLTVVGGTVEMGGGARVDGGTRAYAGGLSYRRRDDRIVWVEGLGEDPAAAADTVPGRRTLERGIGSDATLELSIADTYNRTEGFAVRVGPTLRIGRENPLVLHGHGILRTEGGRTFGPRRKGFDVGAEQSLPPRRALRIGGRYYSQVEDVEAWQVSDVETSLSTMVLGHDLRDQYEREGWSAHLRVRPRTGSVEGGLELRDEAHRAMSPGNPWAIFRGAEGWRPQPLVAEGRLRSLVGSGSLDTRQPRSDPSTGWYATAEVEQALHSTLTRPGAFVVDPATGSLLAAVEPLAYGTFTHGRVDVRRYNRLGPDSRLNLRLVAGGALDGGVLPPQRQHALGGIGTVPGFSHFSLDCGARSALVRRPASPHPLDDQGVVFHPAYGCDAFTMVQAEYRGDLRFRFRVGRDDRDDDGRRRRSGRRTSARITWVLFADAARAWSFADDSAHDAADVGAGVLFDEIGIYGALPVSSGGGLRLFLRLQPRF